MKLAASSSSFHDSIERGDLTQLEFLDHAANELRADGVVLDVRHFPRTDDDYLAHVKKMAIDYGLTIAAVWSARALAEKNEVFASAMTVAAGVGAPLLAVQLANETALSRSDQSELVSDASGAAKRANIVLALRNAAGTFAATSADCKRVAKEADSAWLRFGLEPSAFDAASAATDLAERAVLLWSGSADPAAFIEQWTSFAGFTIVDSNEKSAHRAWRRALCEFELNRT